MTKLDSNYFNYDIALFPHTVKGSMIEINIDFHCHRGIQNQRPVWRPILNEEIVGLVTPDQAAYSSLKYQLINRMENDYNYPAPSTTIAFSSFNDPVLHPIGMAYDERGLVNPAVHALLSGTKLQTAVMRWAFFNLRVTLEEFIPAALNAIVSAGSFRAPSMSNELKQFLISQQLLEDK